LSGIVFAPVSNVQYCSVYMGHQSLRQQLVAELSRRQLGNITVASCRHYLMSTVYDQQLA